MDFDNSWDDELYEREEEITKNFNLFYDEYKIDDSETVEGSGFGYLVKQILNNEITKLGTPFKTMKRDVYYANNYTEYVLVLHVDYYYKDEKDYLKNLGWTEIPGIEFGREYSFVKVFKIIK